MFSTVHLILIIGTLAMLLVSLLVLPDAAATLPSGFVETPVASGLAAPTAMAFAPDGRLFVCEQNGRLRVIKNGNLLPAPFVTLTVDSNGERGLLGVAFDPNFASNQFVYVYYTTTAPAVHNRVSRFTANGDVSQSSAEFVDALISAVRTVSGVDLATRRSDLINEYSLGANQTDSRGRVLRKLIEYAEYRQTEFNGAFVLAQYFGYLRRDPDEGGFQFWLDVLNNRVPNNYRSMVCAFITSSEYQRRFSSVVTRSNQDCGP